MNVNDTEVVWSILQSQGYSKTTNPAEADVYLIVTCSIREGSESKIWRKLHRIALKKSGKGHYRKTMKVGLLGCMAERLKEQLLSLTDCSRGKSLVDVVAGPDSYKDLPRLLAVTNHSGDQTAINVLLSVEETYADVLPARLVRLINSGIMSYLVLIRITPSITPLYFHFLLEFRFYNWLCFDTKRL